MANLKPSALIASLIFHSLLVLIMTPGHHEEHTIQLFKGFIELGESGDGHSSRPHLHHRKKIRQTEEQAIPQPQTQAQTAIDISTPSFDGNAGSAKTLSEGDLYLLEVIKKIRSLQRYPRESLIREEEGVVRVTLTIAEDGTISQAKVSWPCAYEALNQSALQSVKLAGPFAALPKIWDHPIRVQIPIHYELSGR